MRISTDELAGSQSGMTELLVEDEDTFVTNTCELEDGVQGVRSALGSFVIPTEEARMRMSCRRLLASSMPLNL